MKGNLSTFAPYNLARVSRIVAFRERLAKARVKCHSRFVWAYLSFAAILFAVPTLHADSYYYPNLFDISITFGCNCTCFCETNAVETNNPVSMFLNANPVAWIKSTAKMPPSGQKVPPHYTELLSLTTPPLYGDTVGDDYTFPPVGWTVTQSSATVDHGLYGYTLFHPVIFNLNYPISDSLNYYFYAGALPSDPNSSPAGQALVQSQTQFQPYPWDVNLTLELQNGQLYYMEQQLVVGYDPVYNSQPLATPVDYVETNSLMTISLYCTNGGQTNVLSVSGATITATLLPDNIPVPLNQNIGWAFTPEFYTNWAWPLTFDDLAAPNALSSPPGAAGTVQASLNLGGGNLDHVNLLVRANRAYQIDMAYYLNGYYIENLTITNTGLMPACTNVEFSFYTDICTNPFVSHPPTVCLSTNVGLVDMMAAPDVWTPLPPDVNDSGITMWGSGAGNIFKANLTGASLLGLPGTPVPFTLPVFMVNQTSAIFEKWATEGLGLNTSYEYFRSPSVSPVNEQCSSTTDLTNDFVMCFTNPAVVQGAVTLNGCVNSNYYGGTGALSFLRFAVYTSGLPYDPPGLPTAGIADPKLQFVSSIQATNGASAFSPFDVGHGFASTEFDNSGAFGSPNDYFGHYAMKLAGVTSLPSFWDVNDLHLVFVSPVSLDYHVILTNSPYTNVNISCGAIVTNDIKLCFGLVSIQVSNAFPVIPPNGIPSDLIYKFANIQVSGTGPGYVVSPLDFNNYPFDHTSPTLNDVRIPLFLPQGSYQYVTTVLTAGGPGNPPQYLVLGTNYFTVYCCTNSCQVVVDCPTNKTVSCATNWTFDLPTVHTNCCGTNYSINVYASDVTSNTGPCSMTSTRTWLITDCNGDTIFCSQTVTVSPPSTYTVILQPGYNLIANQLNNVGGNTANVLFPNNGSRDFDQLQFYNGCTNGNYTTYTFDSSFPTGFADASDSVGVAAPTLSPGQGVFYYNNTGSPETVTFTGTPECPPSPDPLCPCGTQTLVSYKLDCLGTYEDITGLQPQQGVEVRRWNGNGYTVDTFNNGAWTLGAPVLNIGEAAFILIPCPINPTNPLPVINIGTLGGATISATFNLGGGNGAFTFSNNAWFTSGGNYNYTLQSSTNLLSTNWMTVCNAIPTIGYTFTNAGPINFYRLQLRTNN
jgi:hypothetical protein